MRIRVHAMAAAVLWLAAPAFAESGTRAFAVPLDRTPLALGSGYDAETNRARGEAGACVTGDDTQRRDATGPRYSIATLTRAGGRLVVGIHVSAPLFIETLTNPRIPDAARRLERADGVTSAISAATATSPRASSATSSSPRSRSNARTCRGRWRASRPAPGPIPSRFATRSRRW